MEGQVREKFISGNILLRTDEDVKPLIPVSVARGMSPLDGRA